MADWAWVKHPATGGVHRIPDDPAVRRQFAARGWEPTDEPSEEEPIPEAVDTDEESSEE